MLDRVTEAPMTVYRDGLRQGRLLYQHGLDADRAFFPPRLVCPHTANDRFEWRESAGRGSVYSVSNVRARDKPSYAVALIDLDEGFRMLSRIVNATGEEVAIGTRVRLTIGTGEQSESCAFFEPDTAA